MRNTIKIAASVIFVLGALGSILLRLCRDTEDHTIKQKMGGHCILNTEYNGFHPLSLIIPFKREYFKVLETHIFSQLSSGPLQVLSLFGIAYDMVTYTHPVAFLGWIVRVYVKEQQLKVRQSQVQRKELVLRRKERRLHQRVVHAQLTTLSRKVDNIEQTLTLGIKHFMRERHLPPPGSNLHIYDPTGRHQPLPRFNDAFFGFIAQQNQ